MSKSNLIDKGIILKNGEICKDKINLVSGAITQPFAEMVWASTGGDKETINRFTDILVTMNNDTERDRLFNIIQMCYGLMGVMFSDEAACMNKNSSVLKYFIFSFIADFGEIMQEYLSEKFNNDNTAMSN